MFKMVSCSPLNDLLLELDTVIEYFNSVDTSTSGELEEQMDGLRRGPYRSFFNALLKVIKSSENKDNIEPTEGPPVTPTTSNPPLVNPDRTDGSITGSKISSTSSEGKPEEAAKVLAYELVSHVMGAMGNDFRTIKWTKSPHTMRIAEQ
jgi:hypothetical protein